MTRIHNRMNYDKLDERIEYMFNYDSSNYLTAINLDKTITDKLFIYQHVHVFSLIAAMQSNNIIVDGSDTGTGKTFCAIAVCKHLKLNPLIVCPKTIRSSWAETCKYFGVTPITIVNYETIKNGKQYDDDNNRITSSFITINPPANKQKYTWNLPRNTVLIFDEVHRCKNKNTNNGKLLIAARKCYKVMMLSATIADTPKSFHIFGYMLKFYNSVKHGRNWINGMIREDMNYIGETVKLSAIHKQVFPKFGSSIRISDLADQFPKNQVSADCYYIDQELVEEVNKNLNISYDNYDKLSGLSGLNGKSTLAIITKARQKIELIKLNIIVDLAKDYMDNGYSVVIFVNFNKTINCLIKKLKTNCIIRGGQDIDTRLLNISNFQENKSNIIISNMKAGGEAISLHDKYGKPRVSIISPSFSSIQLTQVLGRISRAGAKTPALQRIIYCANTCEEAICTRIKEKLKFTAKINDSDLIKL